MTLTTFNLEELRAVPLHKLVGNMHIHRRVKIRCPFHQERTGSCTLFPTGGFHCFGCGAHGNSLDFIINMGYSFEEACKELEKHL